MAQIIELCIEDDGTMYVSSEPKEVEETEEPKGTPVKSIEEALQVIEQMVGEASMAPPAEEIAPEEEMVEEAPAPPAGEEEAAMMANYKPR